MTTRRTLLLSAAVLAAGGGATVARADTTADTAFVQQLGLQLEQVVNGPGTDAQKSAALEPLIGRSVDSDAIARFCLGVAARSATPQQLAEFQQVFHQVLLNNITGRLGKFRGVTFTMTQTQVRGDESYVGTVIKRPNEDPNNVQWVVSHATGAPKIVDVVAEGTSLRQTQRSDYRSYLQQHGNDVNALLAALRKQVAAGV